MTPNPPSRPYRGPGRQRVLDLLEESEETAFTSTSINRELGGVPLGRGAPTAVLGREPDGWVIRQLVGQPDAPSPRAPCSWWVETGTVLVRAETKAELAEIIREMDWPWGDP